MPQAPVQGSAETVIVAVQRGLFDVDGPLEDALAAVLYETRTRQPDCDMVCAIAAKRALLALDRCWIPEPRSTLTSFDQNDIFFRITQHIEENIATVTPQTLSEALHFNPRYYNRLIRKRTGLTLTRFIQQKRIAATINLLSESDLPVSAIIKQVGYQNSDYFYRIFREATGMTPGEYRVRAAENGL